MTQTSSPEISIVVPFFNEEDNVEPLYNEIMKVVDEIGKTYELILINDGSHDCTFRRLREIADGNNAVIVIDLLRNYGQTAAMMAGFDHAAGSVIVALDGDGQNDPASIPVLLQKIDEGYTVASGWRKDRKDKTITRKIPSVIANHLISRISGVELKDHGCSLKAYKRDIIADVRLYGEMHRFIPIYASWQGAKITEVVVNHRARVHGTTKYGLNRIFKVLLDLLLVSFMGRYMTKPIYVFGGVGIFLLFLACLTFAWAIGLKVVTNTSFILTPLPILTGTFFTTGVLCILMGLLAEIVIRTYFESQQKRVYQVRSVIENKSK